MLDGVILAVALVAVGIVAGAASGLLGVGGGIVMVPFLVLLTSLGFRDAVQASLLSMVVVTPFGLWGHWRAGNVRRSTGLLLGVSGFAGVLVATLVDPLLNEPKLQAAFAVVLLLAARRLVYGKTLPTPREGVLWPIGLGLAAGFVAKLFGIGGGIVMVPGLVMSGLPIHHAIGTSLAAVWTNAVLSSLVNVTGRTDAAWMLFALPLAVGSLVGIRFGVLGALRSRAEPLRRGFGFVMISVALVMFARSLDASI